MQDINNMTCINQFLFFLDQVRKLLITSPSLKFLSTMAHIVVLFIGSIETSCLYWNITNLLTNKGSLMKETSFEKYETVSWFANIRRNISQFCIKKSYLHSHQTIQSHVRNSLLTSMGFNMGIFGNPNPDSNSTMIYDNSATWHMLGWPN